MPHFRMCDKAMNNWWAMFSLPRNHYQSSQHEPYSYHILLSPPCCRFNKSLFCPNNIWTSENISYKSCIPLSKPLTTGFTIIVGFLRSLEHFHIIVLMIPPSFFEVECVLRLNNVLYKLNKSATDGGGWSSSSVTSGTFLNSWIKHLFVNIIEVFCF